MSADRFAMTDPADPSGWWQASDGKWYPPEARPVAPPVAVVPPVAAPPVAAPPVAPPPAAPAVAPPAAPPKDPVKVSYDQHGWIKIEEPAAPVAPGPPPKPAWQANIGLVAAIAVAVVVVVAAAITFVPRGAHRSADAVGVTDTTAPDGTDDVDPLTLDSVLAKINIQHSDVGEGYDKITDGAIDPIGGDPCTQPTRPFVNVAGTNWTAYDYIPAGFSGNTGGHLAGAVTVYDHTADANKRMQTERAPAYAQCLARWDQQVWEAISGYKVVQQRIDPVPVSIPGATAFSYRYIGALQIGDRFLPVYSDHIVFTKGRVRVWVEVSSITGPFDQARRDLLVSRMSNRLDDALA